jgi:hypothetical protein
VVWYFIGRQKSRDYWRHLAVPVIGFAILVAVVVNAQVTAQRLGFIWLVIGLVLMGVLLATGRKPELKAEETL